MEEETTKFDPKDLENSYNKIIEGTAPCNIHKLIKNILTRLEALEQK